MTPPAGKPARSATSLSPAAVATLANELRLSCMRISRRVRFESDHEVAPHQFSVLARLEGAPKTPGELAEIERVSPPSMSRTVASLVERGLVGRTDDPADRRQVILALTPDGAQLIKDIRRKRDQWMSIRVRRLSPDEQAVLRQASAILARVASE